MGGLALANTLFGFENRWGKVTFEEFVIFSLATQLSTTIYAADYINELEMTDYHYSTGVGRVNFPLQSLVLIFISDL